MSNAGRSDVAVLPIALPADDRRRNTRIRLLRPIPGRVVDVDDPVPALLREVSAAGFAVDCRIRFTPGSVAVFGFAGLDESVPPIVVAAKAFRSVPGGHASEYRGFITGFEYAAEQPATTPDALAAWAATVAVHAGGLAVQEGRSPDTDRRRVGRLRLNGELHGVLTDEGGREISCFVQDLSLGGTCIEAHVSLPVESAVTISLQLHDLFSLMISCRVAWCHVRSGGPHTPRFRSGLQFTCRTREGRRAIAVLIARLQATFRGMDT